MRFLAWVFLLLGLGLALSRCTMGDPGYVLISRPPFSIEMSFTAFVPMLIVTFLLFAAALYLLISVLRIPTVISRRHERRRAAVARTALTEGLMNLAEGRFAEAERVLRESALHADTPLLHYLAAAIAAQAGGNPATSHARRDEHLARAQDARPEERLAIGLVQAWLHVEAREFERALATLNGLRQEHPQDQLQNGQILRLTARVYEALHDWTALADLVPALRDRQALPGKDIDALERKAHFALLEVPVPVGARDALDRAWAAVPEALRGDPAFVTAHARQRQRVGDLGRAAEDLTRAWNTRPDPRLIRLYGTMNHRDPNAALAQARLWLSERPADAEVALAAGRLARRAGRMDEAQDLLERAIALGAPPEVFRELGEIAASAGEAATALAWYRRGSN